MNPGAGAGGRGGIILYPEMRRIDRQISEDKSREVLIGGDYGFLSFIGLDGAPCGIPLGYVYYRGNIYFHCAHEGYKLSCIERNGRVSFCVVGDYELLPDKFTTHYKSVVVCGRASLAEDEEKAEALNALVAKYSAGFEAKAEGLKRMVLNRTKVVKITIERMTGKQNPVLMPDGSGAEKPAGGDAG